MMVDFDLLLEVEAANVADDNGRQKDDGDGGINENVVGEKAVVE